MAEVAVEGVTKIYPGNVAAVRDVSFTVADREFLVLVGPSGCGKTTMLRLIAGLEEVTRGAISIGGRVVNDLAPKDRDVAMVFQHYALYPHMSVRANMGFGLKLRGYGRREREARVREAAEVLGLADLLNRKPRALSGGQRQRVALGRAIVRQPKVFLFDEPLSNLDAKRRVEMRAELKQLHRRLEATVIYVTHDQVEAMTLGQRIAVLDEGRIRQIGPPLEVYDRPANRFVAGFIGTPAMNFLEGRVRTSGGGRVFDAGHCTWPLPARLAGPGAPADGPAVLGIRPEDLSVGADGPLPAVITAVEQLGERQLVRLAVGAHALTARMAAHDRAEPGMAVRATFAPAKMHLFDAATGLAVGCRARAP